MFWQTLFVENLLECQAGEITTEQAGSGTDLPFRSIRNMIKTSELHLVHTPKLFRSYSNLRGENPTPQLRTANVNDSWWISGVPKGYLNRDAKLFITWQADHLGSMLKPLIGPDTLQLQVTIYSINKEFNGCHAKRSWELWIDNSS